MQNSPNRLRLLAVAAAVLVATGARGAGPREKEPAWLGIFLGDALDGGVQIVAVIPDGPAARGGLERGDVVLAVGGKETENRLVLGEAVDTYRSGQDVPIRVLRDGRVEELNVRAGRSPLSASWRVAPFAPESGPENAFRFGPEDPAVGWSLREIPTELRRHLGAPETAGILVASIAPETAAARAGVRVGDVIVRAGGRPVARTVDLALAVPWERGGSLLDLVVVRDGENRELRMEVPQRPGSEARRVLAERDAEIRRLREEVEALERALEAQREDARRDDR